MYGLPWWKTLEGKGSACNVGDLGLVPGLGRSLGEGNGNHSSTLAWKISWTEAPNGLQSMGGIESDMSEVTGMHALGQKY